MSGVFKQFSGVTVLEDVDFSLEEGEVRALVGGNGAGKSTLMKILTGVYTIDGGEVRVHGEAVHFKGFGDAREAGIGMIFQELSLIPTMTIAENIFLSCELTRGGIHVDDREQRRRASKLLESLGLKLSPDEKVSHLTVGDSQLVEIAKALATNARILIMDEPTASLSDKETYTLFELIRRLKENGVSIVYISHRMGEIFRIADSITVLKDGKIVSTRAAGETDIRQVITDMIGREAGEGYRYRHRDTNPEVLFSVTGLQVDTPVPVEPADITVHRGEVVGIAGLMGSGRTEILETLFGLTPGTNSVTINGVDRTIGSVADAMEAGIALVPDDRRLKGLVLRHSVLENLTLPNISRFTRMGKVVHRAARRFTREAISRYNVKTEGIDRKISLLSGGNQQKVVIAKWLTREPELLLLDEPTAGVDIGAKVQVLEFIRAYSDAGHGVLVVSSEIPELIAMCDRILVMHNGRITKVIRNTEDLDEERIQHEIQHEA